MPTTAELEHIGTEMAQRSMLACMLVLARELLRASDAPTRDLLLSQLQQRLRETRGEHSYPAPPGLPASEAMVVNQSFHQAFEELSRVVIEQLQESGMT